MEMIPMKRFAAAVVVCTLLAGMLAGCGGNGNTKNETSSTIQQSSSTEVVEVTPEPTATPEPYFPNPLTGLEKDESYPEGQRITAVMVNNIKACRPQRGLSDAKVLYEIKVEGGITRFMALYDDYNTIPTVGPIRSARDQFFRLVLPFQPLYVHIGESSVQKQYIADYDYDEWNIDDKKSGNLFWRDNNRLAQGYATEHTAYTDGEHISNALQNLGTDDRRSYNSCIFDFVNYNEPARVLEGGEATNVEIIHSIGYKTKMDYDAASGKYLMSMYGSNGYTPTKDENNGKQLAFDNVLVLFTDIHTYPGHEAKDLQYAAYGDGGVGYYYNGGRYEKIRWLKGGDLDVLRIVSGDGTETPVQLNCGTSYVTVVDIDEAINFQAPDAQTSSAE